MLYYYDADKTFTSADKPFFTASQIYEMSSVTCLIPKDMVLSNDCTKMALQLDEFRKAGCTGFAKLHLGFKEYDQDGREAFQIPEIRAYIRKLYTMYPELLLYFPHGEDYYYASCLLDVDFVRNGNRNKVTVRSTASNRAKMQEIDEACRWYKSRMCDDYCRLHDEYHTDSNTSKSNC